MKIEVFSYNAPDSLTGSKYPHDKLATREAIRGIPGAAVADKGKPVDETLLDGYGHTLIPYRGELADGLRAIIEMGGLASHAPKISQQVLSTLCADKLIRKVTLYEPTRDDFEVTALGKLAYQDILT